MTLIASEKPVLDVDRGSDRTWDALNFIHKLLQATGEEWTLPALLRKLAQAFAAESAGLAAPLAGPLVVRHSAGANGKPPGPYPWDRDPELLTQVTNAPWGVGVGGADGDRWLLTAVAQPNTDGCLLWLYDGADRAWTSGESAALTLAGQALTRLAAAGAGNAGWAKALEQAHFQRRLENAAVITGRLAHDFGNVLTGILGFAELSLTQSPPDFPSRSYLQEICESAQRGADWVRKLQVFSGTRRAHAQSSELAPVLAEEEARARADWGSGVALLVSLAKDLPALAVDADSLRQLLAPLLTNAREAIAERGVVSLSARAIELNDTDSLELSGAVGPGRYVEITITDTGSGMSPETRRRLWAEVFYSTKPRHRGLGLAMVHGILRSVGGGLRFGPGPQQGTAVHLFVPVAKSQAPAALKQAVRPNHGRSPQLS